MKKPESVWSIENKYADEYAWRVQAGRRVAADLSVAVVGIARNALPHIQNTLDLVGELRAGFRDLQMFVFENDSSDGTGKFLDDFATKHTWFRVEHEVLGGDDSRGFERERTERLAYCRNKCHEYVSSSGARPFFVIVLDLDPEYGFSVDGVFDSVYWMGTPLGLLKNGGMASYSLCAWGSGQGRISAKHYDAWAARPLCFWEDRRGIIGFDWFASFLPPVGSRPMPMNSAFGGLCVYSTEAFLSAGKNPYEGGDCEHVFLHKKMHDSGWQLYLNPGCRYIAHWPE